ncbi:MAG: phage recombination protein Bet, partial [Pseudomonadota bacterium]
RQIYAIVVNKNKHDKRQLVVVTGIDGYRSKAARQQDYRPDEAEPVITYNKEMKDPATNPLGIEKATVRCFKQDNRGAWHAVVGTAYWDEFAPLEEEWAYDQEQGKRVPTGQFKLKGNWLKMGRVMICKCAEAQGIRKGWPDEFSGLYVSEEMEGTTATEAVEQARAEARLAITKTKDTIALQFDAGQQIAYVPTGEVADRVAEWLGKAESPTQVEAFQSLNQMGLREFWAREKSDALDLKKLIEARIKELDVEATTAELGQEPPPNHPTPQLDQPQILKGLSS